MVDHLGSTYLVKYIAHWAKVGKTIFICKTRSVPAGFTDIAKPFNMNCSPALDRCR